MAEEYHAGICTGNLWSSSRNFPIGTYSPCSSMVLNDNMGSFGWSMDVMNMDLKQNRLVYDDDYDHHHDHSTSVWDDLSSLIHGDESSQSDNNSSRLNYQQQSEMSATNWISSSKHFSEINDENNLMNVSSCQQGDDDVPVTNFLLGSNNLFETASSMVLQNLFEELEYETPSNGHNSFIEKPNGTDPYCNVARKAQHDQEKPNGTYLGTKNEVRVLMGKKNIIADEPTFKRQRIETPSHMPTFKVRKEKLGDRVTALQQLVSPFGKTDTASVLHEAIDYIKYLHGQVNVLTTPYMKDVAQYTQDIQNKQTLRSQGLCLVPISSTYSMANQFW